MGRRKKKCACECMRAHEGYKKKKKLFFVISFTPATLPKKSQKVNLKTFQRGL